MVLVDDDTRQVRLTYALSSNLFSEKLAEQSWKFVRLFADGEEDIRQICLQVGLLLLGDIRFVEQRNRSEYRIVLLGEAFKWLRRAME